MSTTFGSLFWSIASLAVGLPIVIAWGIAAAVAYRRRSEMPHVFTLLAAGFGVVLLRVLVDVGVRAALLANVTWTMTLVTAMSVSSWVGSLLLTGVALLAVFADRGPAEQADV